jgi:MFS family permease
MIVVALAAALGWRGVWLASAALLGVGLVPLMLWLLKGHGARHRRLLTNTADRRVGAERAEGRQWTLRQVLGDPRFYLILPLALALASIGTGIVFHQVHLTETKGWDLAWYAGSFVGLAASSIIFSLLAGPLVDRLGAARLVPFYAIPAGLAVIALAAFDAPLTAYAFMILFGASEGASRSIMGAFWAERYGVLHLGAIRGLVSALAIIGTSLSPVLMGWLFDQGVGFASILYFCAAYMAAAIGLALISLYARPESR